MMPAQVQARQQAKTQVKPPASWELKQKKACSKCGTVKPLLEFPSNKDSSDGRGSYCRPCKAELAKERRIKDAGARLRHYIVTRIRNETPKDKLPKDLETNLEHYLGYKLYELRRHLRETVQAEEGISLTKSFIDGYHLDHRTPLSSFKSTRVGDEEFRKCWAITNLKMIPALQNLRKGSKVEALVNKGLELRAKKEKEKEKV